MRKLTFEQYQKENKEAFKNINGRFNDEQIFWFAHSGTLLGSKRNGKLIPWDDDIDMAMTAKEFYSKKDKIESIGKEFNYSLADKATYIGNSVSRLICDERIIVEYNGVEYVTSFFIDIMIAIPLKKESKLRTYWWFISCRILIIFSGFWKPLPSYRYGGEKPVKISWIEHFLVWIGRLFVLPLALLHYSEKRLLKKASKKDGSVYAMHYGWSHLQQYYVMNEMEEAIIEDTKIFVTKKWNEELETRYGKNWIELPHKDKRRPHHIVLTPYNKGKNKYDIFPFIIK